MTEPSARYCTAMSEENVEAVRRMLEAAAGDDIDAVAATFASDIEWDLTAYPLPGWANMGRGREGLRDNLVAYRGGWREYRAEARALLDAGDEVLLELHETVRLPDSDAVLERVVYNVWTVRHGLLVRLRVFKTKTEALEAAGLSE